MAENQANVNPDAELEEDLLQEDTLSARFMEWVRTEFVWYAGSFTVHLLGLAMLLLLGNFAAEAISDDVAKFDALKDEAKQEKPPEQPKMENLDISEPERNLEPAATLDVDPTLTEKPGRPEQKEEYYDESLDFQSAGGPGMASAVPTKDVIPFGQGGFSVVGHGPGPKIVGGGGGVFGGTGTGKEWGSGGTGTGFGGRGSGHRKYMAATYGGTRQSERSVTAALIWLARHQGRDGGWSLTGYQHQCKDKTCTGPGQNADSGATAMGLLPFLAAGQTHKTGSYTRTVDYGLKWLMAHQKPDGDLRNGANMYSHGLASIALCEAYGLTKDRTVGAAAARAIGFILTAQNKQTGGWRYGPGEAGDTSVVGWQVMALKSAQMAGLIPHGGSHPGNAALELSSKWLDSCASGNYKSRYGYTGPGGSNTMTAVGLLCRQYLGVKKEDPMIGEGCRYLMTQNPDAAGKNIYYYYYATQVMHNVPGTDWDNWNRKMRRVLIESQHGTKSEQTKDCANGSWDPAGDTWGSHGGRVMQTSLSCLTLEVYYRYLPLYKLDREIDAAPAAAPGAKPEADAAPELKVEGEGQEKPAGGEAAPAAPAAPAEGGGEGT